MAEVSQSAIAAIVQPVLDAWLRKDERRAAKDAGSLMFWRTGMLKELEAIRDGEGSAKTFVDLRRQFNESADDVNKTADALTAVRDKLAGTPIADVIDELLYGKIGKLGVRQKIESIIALRDGTQDQYRYEADLTEEMRDTFIRQEAAAVCRDIDALNATITRLNRMVNGPR